MAVSKTNLPHDEEAERVVIETLITYPSLIPRALRTVEPEHFWTSRYREVYSTMVRLYSAEAPFQDNTAVLTRDMIAAGMSDADGRLVVGPDVLPWGVDYMLARPEHIDWFAGRILDTWKRRRAISRLSKATMVAQESAEDAVAAADALTAELEQAERRTQSGRVSRLLTQMRQERADLELVPSRRGVATQIEWLDRRTDGLLPGRVWIIGGYTGVGKTCFATALKLRVLESGLRLLDFSLEMSAVDTAARLLGLKAGVPPSLALTAQMGAPARERWEQAEAWLEGLSEQGRYQLYGDQRQMTTIGRLIQAERPQAVIVDYLQNLVRSKGEEEYDLLTRAVQTFQTLCSAAGREHICVLVSQLSNEGYRWAREDRNYLPFKGTAQIGADASVAILLERDKTAAPVRPDGETGRSWWQIDLQLRKNRWGREGRTILHMDPAVGWFREVPG